MEQEVTCIEANIYNILLTLADNKFCEFSKKIVNSKTKMLGVKVPELRKVAKNLLNEYDLSQIMKMSDNRFVEFDYIKAFCVGYAKINLEQKLIMLAELSKKWDNWAVCDSGIATIKIKNNQLNYFFDFCKTLLSSKFVFSVRLGIVGMIDFLIVEDYYLKVLEFAKNIPQGKDYYIDMALAWMLSILLVKFFDKTIEYLIINKHDFNEFVFNKALQKARESFRLTDSQKLFLKSIKK